jgi:chromosome segregation ATPase
MEVEQTITKHDRQITAINENITDLKVDLNILITKVEGMGGKVHDIFAEMKTIIQAINKFSQDYINQQSQIISLHKEISELKISIAKTQEEVEKIDEQTKGLATTFNVIKKHWVFFCATIGGCAWVLDWLYRYWLRVK